MDKEKRKNLIVGLGIVAGVILLGPYFGLNLLGSYPAQPGSRRPAQPLEASPVIPSPQVVREHPERPDHPSKSNKGGLTEIEKLLK